jgi:hypothetical protein
MIEAIPHALVAHPTTHENVVLPSSATIGVGVGVGIAFGFLMMASSIPIPIPTPTPRAAGLKPYFRNRQEDG